MPTTARAITREIGNADGKHPDDEPSLMLVEIGRPWSCDGDGNLLRRVSEARLIAAIARRQLRLEQIEGSNKSGF